MADQLPDVRKFGALFSEFVESMSTAARAVESEVTARMRAHLGTDPRELPTTSAEFAPTDHPNLQLALDAVLPDAAVIGMSASNPGFMMFGLSGLLSERTMVGPVDVGPVQYTDVEVGDGRAIRCISTGVLLVRLYAQDVPLEAADEDDLVVRTDGLTGAFIKELMRQAGLRATLENRPPHSRDATAALEELLGNAQP
jgi:hypothetical protein